MSADTRVYNLEEHHGRLWTCDDEDVCFIVDTGSSGIIKFDKQCLRKPKFTEIRTFGDSGRSINVEVDCDDSACVACKASMPAEHPPASKTFGGIMGVAPMSAYGRKNNGIHLTTPTPDNGCIDIHMHDSKTGEMRIYSDGNTCAQIAQSLPAANTYKMVPEKGFSKFSTFAFAKTQNKKAPAFVDSGAPASVRKFNLCAEHSKPEHYKRCGRTVTDKNAYTWSGPVENVSFFRQKRTLLDFASQTLTQTK